MALVVEGRAKMRVNHALDAGEVEAGYVLTCQAIPTSREIVVDYEA
jgi:ring-1,2-phenylacetyl-CoA epoxidase subunit PaaE